MQTTIDGVRWRLRFRHVRAVGTKGQPSTQCFVEVWEKHVELEGWFSVTGVYGETTCSRKDNFEKETGRQYALLRALRAGLVKGAITKQVASQLIHSYAVSGGRKPRLLADDLSLKGFRSLYDAVFDPERLWDWHASVKTHDTDMITDISDDSSLDWPWCEPCGSWHQVDNPNCIALKEARRA